MTATARAVKIDLRHFAIASGFCPRCGARRKQGLPCPVCSESREWEEVWGGAQKGGEFETFKGGDAA